MAKRQLRFFLGANTPLGFVSRMDQLCDPQRYSRVLILKGGPGSGKSALLSRIADALEAAGRPVERIACSFAPERLDAVASGKIAVLDGSAPHNVDPHYPGAVENIVWMGDCWDEGALRARKEEILALTAQKERLCEQSSRYLAAADALCSDNWRLVLEATDVSKIERQAERIAEREFSGTDASERVRLLSATTASGHVLFSDTARLLADRIVLLEDEYGPSSSLLLASLRRLALSAGCEVISCTSPFAPYERLEHLFLPALSLGFVTANGLLSPEVEPTRVINARRFTDRGLLSSRKKRIGFNKKASQQMLLQAQALLADAGQIHRALEAIYIPAVDHQEVEDLAHQIISRLL